MKNSIADNAPTPLRENFKITNNDTKPSATFKLYYKKFAYNSSLPLNLATFLGNGMHDRRHHGANCRASVSHHYVGMYV